MNARDPDAQPTEGFAPKPGSLAEQVVNYFRINPTETLTLDDIAEKFSVKGNIIVKLEEVLAQRWIERLPLGRDTFAAGPNLPRPLNPSFISAAKPKGGPKHGAKRGHLPVLDIDALRVDEGVAMPKQMAGRNSSRWLPLLEKLEKVGDSIKIPREYNATVTAYKAKRIKLFPADLRRYKVGLDEAGVNRIWRTA